MLSYLTPSDALQRLRHLQHACLACLYREIGAFASDKNYTSEDQTRIGRITSNSITFQANRRQGADWDTGAVARPDFNR
jgi:hypothetical protein